MTLTLLVGPDPVGATVIFADPAGGSSEPLIAGLTAVLPDARRLIFPLPDETTTRHATPVALARSRHADLWHGLSADERSRVLIAAGPSAAYLAPVAPAATTLVAVPDPGTMRPAVAPFRGALGPFSELDELVDGQGLDGESAGWRASVSKAISRFQLLRGEDPEALTVTVASAVELAPRRVERAGRAAAQSANAGPTRPRRDYPAHWLDALLYELSAEPDRPSPPGPRG